MRRLSLPGIACLFAAVLSATAVGVWEAIDPMFGQVRYRLDPSSPAQLWTYGIVQALKPLGFVPALGALAAGATRRGLLVRTALVLAAAGGAFYAVVWIAIAVTGRDDAVYIGERAIGSDVHSNGGVFFLLLAPLAIGVAAFTARRIPRWQALWVAATGVLGAVALGILGPGLGLVAEGIAWAGIGLIVVGIARRRS